MPGSGNVSISIPRPVDKEQGSLPFVAMEKSASLGSVFGGPGPSLPPTSLALTGLTGGSASLSNGLSTGLSVSTGILEQVGNFASA